MSEEIERELPIEIKQIIKVGGLCIQYDNTDMRYPYTIEIRLGDNMTTNKITANQARTIFAFFNQNCDYDHLFERPRRVRRRELRLGSEAVPGRAVE